MRDSSNRPLLLKFELELFELELKFTYAFGLRDVSDNLEVAALLVDGNAAVQDDGCAVVEKVHTTRIAKHDAAHGGFAIADAEVGVARSGDGQGWRLRR